MSGTTPPNKKELLYKLLERGSVFVHLDPRRERVAVPQWLAVKPQLVLQLGLNFPIPIRDLEIDDDGIRCTLSFNRAPFYCILPWSAVYALVGDDGQVTVWPSELPSELVPPAETASTTRRNAPRERRAPKNAPRSAAEKRDRNAAADMTDAPAPSSTSAPVPLGRARMSLVKPLPVSETDAAGEPGDDGSATKGEDSAAEKSAGDEAPSARATVTTIAKGSPQTVGDLDRMHSRSRDGSAARVEPMDDGLLDEGGAAASDESASGARDGSAARDGGAARSSTSAGANKKPARERPPYLRLVK